MQKKKYKASALIVSILVLGLILGIALSIVLSSLHEMKASSGASKSSLAYQSADEGVEAVMNDIQMVNRISELSHCADDGLIKDDGFEVTLYDSFSEPRNKINCYSTNPIENVKGIKSIGASDNVFQKSERALDVPVKFMPCNGEVFELEEKNEDGEVVLVPVPEPLTRLILHMDGGDDGESFIDSFMTNHNVSESGNVQITKEKNKFCRSAKFDGASGYLSIDDSDDWNFGNQNFTIDLWVYPTEIPSNKFFVSSWQTAGTGKREFAFGSNISSQFYFVAQDSTNENSSLINLSGGDIKANEWQHVAVVRDGTDAYLFVNGVKKAEQNNVNGTIIDGSADLLIDGVWDSSGANAERLFDGYLDEVRISKGVARWDSDFTPPNSPY